MRIFCETWLSYAGGSQVIAHPLRDRGLYGGGMSLVQILLILYADLFGGATGSALCWRFTLILLVDVPVLLGMEIVWFGVVGEWGMSGG